MIEPNSDTRANSLADQIYHDILDSGLREGELFMTGDAVPARYSVSRTVAREALSQLRALGVLKSRQRKGLLVARPDPLKLTAQWVPLYCHPSDSEAFRTLAQFRFALEIGALDLAMNQATESQMEHLAALAREFEALAADHGHTAATDAVDLAFHKTILEMTGNPLIAGMHRILSGYFQASIAFDPRPDASKAIREHHMIADAFRRRDAETVRALMRSHLDIARDAESRSA